MNPLSIDDLKTLLGIPITDTSQDSVLKLTLEASWKFITNYCKRQFIKQEYSEIQIFPDKRRKYIILSEYPVITVNSVKVNEIELTSEDYLIDNRSGVITLLSFENSDDSLFTKVEVVYTAGYEDIKQELPDLYFAGLQLAALRYYSFAHGRLGLKSVNAGGETINVLDMTEGIPHEIKLVLDIYKKSL